MRSIRATLQFRLLVTLALLLLGGGIGVFLAVRSALTAEFDQALSARAASVISAARWDGRRVELDLPPSTMPWYEPGPSAEYFQLRRADAAGKILAASSSLSTAPWRPSLPGPSHGICNSTLPDGRSGRLLISRFTPAPDDELHDAPAAAPAPNLLLITARGRENLDHTLRTLALTLAGASILGALAMALAVRTVLARGLAPLAHLSDQVARIGPASLSRRFDTPALPAELQPISGRLNDLLMRLEEAFARERRFSAAAAHELRTPIAELRTLLEVALSRPRTADQALGVLSDTLAVTLQMERLITSLLALARRELPAPGGAGTDIRAVLDRLVGRHAPRAQALGGAIRLSGPHALLPIDEATVELILDNLLANAVEYASPHPLIACTVELSGPRVLIRVTNPAEGLDPDLLPRFCEPFWRASESRSDRDHLGLGLALAAQCAEASGGVLSLSLSGGTFSADLDLPHVIRPAEHPDASALNNRPEPATT